MLEKNVPMRFARRAWESFSPAHRLSIANLRHSFFCSLTFALSYCHVHFNKAVAPLMSYFVFSYSQVDSYFYKTKVTKFPIGRLKG
jgi:hypothetical protein